MAPDLSPALRDQLDRPPAWMYPWELGEGVVAPVAHPVLPGVHTTRAELIEPRVRDALAEAGPGATAIDLACNEGWFAHRLLDWGAERVVGVDLRSDVIERAELIRQHFGIERERLEFRVGDVNELAGDSQFDVVLVLGLIYHLENPVGALRVARGLTRSLCVVETQLTRQNEPLVHGWGVDDELESATASFAARFEADQDDNRLASVGGVLSLIPNRAALVESMRVAGFEGIEVLDAQPGHNAQYVNGDRAVAVGRTG